MTITNYDAWITSLTRRGVETTGIDKQGNEANFQDYGNALSSEVQQAIIDSFDVAEDKTLQSQIAGLMNGKSVVSTADMIKLLNANGISMKRLESEDAKNSGRLKDEKVSGHGSRATAHGVALYEISDGKGGKFTIADANGNSFIESEELFMNEILSGVSSDIAASAEGLSGPKSVETYNALEANGQLFEKSEDYKQEIEAQKEAEIPQENKTEISQSKFEEIVKDLIESKGWSKDTAKNYILANYSIRGLDEKEAYGLDIDTAA